MVNYDSLTTNDGDALRRAVVAARGEDGNEKGWCGTGEELGAGDEDVDADTDSVMAQFSSNMATDSE